MHRSGRWAGQRWRRALTRYGLRYADAPTREPRFRASRRGRRWLFYFWGVLLVLWILFSAYILFGAWLPWPADHLGDFMVSTTEKTCGDSRGTYCGAISGARTTLLSAGLLYAWWLGTAYQKVRGRRLQHAQEDPRELVHTAGSILGAVVGREQLCGVLIDNLRERKIRRPQIVVGAVGAGKTAVIVKMVELLAERRIVPVSLRLRDMKPGDDFPAMARKRLDVDGNIRSSDEADRAWRQLRADNRVVVVADGLDEAFANCDSGEDAERGRQDVHTQDRDTVLRLAFRHAVEQDLPLVIASRPHDRYAGWRRRSPNWSR